MIAEKTPAPTSSRLVVIGRLLLLLAAAGAALVAWGWIGQHRSGVDSGSYVCPMHPEVTSRSPGECPICRMALEPALPPQADAPPIRSFDRVRQRSFAQEVVAPAWFDGDGTLVASLYKDELAALPDDGEAVFRETAAPAEPVAVRRTGDPPEPWDRSTVRVRFVAVRGPSRPTRDATGRLWLAGKPRALLVMPSAALLEGSDGPHVLVPSIDGKSLDRRPVEVGRVVGGFAFVVSGVVAEERVLVRNPFLYDSELRLHPAAVPPPALQGSP